MKVCVLGHRGMLGHTVAQFLADTGMKVLTLDERFVPGSTGRFFGRVTRLGPDWCINCIGLPPRGDVSGEALMTVNGFLPAALSQALPESCGLIHASSDGVFKPDGADRSAAEIPDATDDYGRSKRFAEDALKRENDFIIRCSIIGEDPAGRTRNLMSWFLSAQGAVSGYQNQMWNGITTLHWAHIAHDILSGELNDRCRVFQPATQPAISKYDLLKLLGVVWNRSIRIDAVNGTPAISRTLRPNVETPGLLVQLLALKAWAETHSV